MRKELKKLLDSICEKTNEDKIWYLFLTKGAKKAQVEELAKEKFIKKAGKGGWIATDKGYSECG